jgi:hypothetical protein
MPINHRAWSRFRVGKTISYTMPGDYNMLAVVTGRKYRWTWRVIDRDTGLVISDAGREISGQSTAARRMADRIMSAYACRWTENLQEGIRRFEDRLEFERVGALERSKMKKDLEFMRAHMRHTMIIARGGLKHATCDLCGQPPDYMGLQLHELMQRGMTVNNPDARELSYVPELTALLCENCHSKAHHPEVRDQLFRIAFKRYGRAQVERAFEHFRRAYELRSTLLDITLPTHDSATFREAHERAGTARARPPPGHTAHHPSSTTLLILNDAYRESASNEQHPANQ